MKTLLLSDIHSNIYALEAIWAKEKDVDLVVCAGDLVDYGPYPKEVLEWIRAHDVRCVQGNHDAWLVACCRKGQALETVPLEERAWVHHNAGLLTEADIAFLEQLPKARTVELEGTVFGVTHLYQDYEEIVSLYAFRRFCGRLFPRTTIKNLIMGHTHLQAVRYLSDTVRWLNPGSVSYRHGDDPDQRAHYATITDGAISLQRLEYDLKPVYAAVLKPALMASETRATEGYFGSRDTWPQESELDIVGG